MSALRLEKLKNWLTGLPGFQLDLASLAPASSDASFRRYFRVANAGQPASLIVMDAPPDHEDVRPFLHVAKLIRDGQGRSPMVYAEQLEDGFLLLEDFGNTTFLQALESQPEDALYRQAITDLVKLQANTATTGLAAYDASKLMQEMNLFEEWFVQKHCASRLTEQESAWLMQIKQTLVDEALAQAPVFVHRDYHSRNLMVLSGDNGLGLIDFQDAVAGPPTYDLVSLLRDAYVEWPEEQTLDWAIRYWEAARKAGVQVHPDASEFYRQMDFMGLQRHLKVVGIFARLNYRDGKSQYLNDLPLVLAYVRIIAGRYIAFKPLLLILDRLENREVKVGYTF